MYRNIVLACAAALGLGLASYAVPTTGALAASAVPTTSALAASAVKNVKSAKYKKRRVQRKKLGFSGRGSGKKKGCWSAECGGGWAPVTDKYIIRQCHLTPSGHKPPPWCK